MKIGIDIGGSHLGIGLINSNGKIIAKEEKDIHNNAKNKNYGEQLVEAIIELITKILEKKKIKIHEISLIGIAVPGTVSNTHIIKADNLHIQNFNIVSEINKYFNIPIYLRNDAKCAAIAEKEYGGLKKYDDALFLTIGTGIGGAVFLGGKLLRPKKYEGFEIGHIVIEKNGIQCNCGRQGCFEKYASMKALKDTVQKEFNRENLTGRELKEILIDENNKPKTDVIINEYIENLSLGLANLINIFEPETISIGGSFVHYKDLMLDKLIKKLNEKNMLFNNNGAPKIVMAKLKNDAGIIGSVIEYKD
jgi:ROK family protein